VARRPQAFAGGARAPDGSAWEVLGERHARNPRLALDGNDLAMLRLWSMARGTGLGGGVLPDAGGAHDQAAIMLEAFAIMSAADAELGATEDER